MECIPHLLMISLFPSPTLISNTQVLFKSLDLLLCPYEDSPSGKVPKTNYMTDAIMTLTSPPDKLSRMENAIQVLYCMGEMQAASSGVATAPMVDFDDLPF